MLVRLGLEGEAHSTKLQGSISSHGSLSFTPWSAAVGAGVTGTGITGTGFLLTGTHLS